MTDYLGLKSCVVVSHDVTSSEVLGMQECTAAPIERQRSQQKMVMGGCLATFLQLHIA